MRRDDLLDLNDVLQHPGRKISVDVSTELPQEEDLDLVAPLDGYLDAVSTGNLLLLTGKFATRAVVECARCGGPVEVDVAFDIDEQFPVEGVPSSFSSQDMAKVVCEEAYELFDGNNMLVEALLRQLLVVAMPIQPLCKFGWDGPCPVAAARGEMKPGDPGRPEFEQLKNLLSSEEKSN